MYRGMEGEMDGEMERYRNGLKERIGGTDRRDGL
jgi:hypothetical protein